MHKLKSSFFKYANNQFKIEIGPETTKTIHYEEAPNRPKQYRFGRNQASKNKEEDEDEPHDDTRSEYEDHGGGSSFGHSHAGSISSDQQPYPPHNHPYPSYDSSYSYAGSDVALLPKVRLSCRRFKCIYKPLLTFQ